MKKTVSLWQTAGFAFAVLAGTCLHFLYRRLGSPVWIAPFCSVNESTWEHMKLLFWPMFAFAVLQSFFSRDCPDFWCVKLRGILLGLLVIPVVFYTWSGAVASPPGWLNILFFFLAAAGAFLCEKRLFDTGALRCKRPYLAFAALALLALCFVVFTFKAPALGIFKDPLTGGYGIRAA